MYKKLLLICIITSAILFSGCYSADTELPALSDSALTENNGITEDESMEVIETVSEPLANITLEELQQKWKNTFPPEGEQDFKNYMYDATGLYAENNLEIQKSDLKKKAFEIAKLLFENYSDSDFTEKIKSYFTNHNDIMDIYMEEIINHVPEYFTNEKVNMTVKQVDIDYLYTFFVQVTGALEDNPLYEQASLYTLVTLEGNSKDLKTGTYFVLLPLRFNRQPVSKEEWGLSFIGGENFYVMTPEHVQGHLKVEGSDAIVHYSGEFLDNWSVISKLSQSTVQN